MTASQPPDDSPDREASDREGRNREVVNREGGERTRIEALLEVAKRDLRWTAMEIHDGFVQQASAALLFVGAAMGEIARGELQASGESLAKAQELLEHAVADARGLINGLRPPELDTLGAPVALHHLAESMTRLSGIQFSTVADALPDSARPLEATLYRIAQEAFSNIRKHSGASQAVLTLNVDAQQDRLTLAVADDGQGLKDSVEPLGGVGLSSMQERATLLGGRMQVLPHGRLGGVEIVIELPILGD